MDPMSLPAFLQAMGPRYGLSLASLDLRAMSFQGPIGPLNIYLPALTSLVLSNNMLSGSLPLDLLSYSSQLGLLDLSNNRIRGEKSKGMK